MDEPLDRIDRRILEELLRDGRMSVSELARRVGLSKTPCQVRLKRLRADGFITRFRAVLDAGKIGREHVAFAEVRLEDTTAKSLRAFNKAALAVPEIEECHMIAGSFDYLLKVRTRDMKDYRHVLGEVISVLPGVASTSSFVSMEAVKDGGAGLSVSNGKT